MGSFCICRCDDNERSSQFYYLLNYKLNVSDSCIVLGDFNSVCCSEQKQGGDRPIDSYLNIFRQFINDFGLLDLGCLYPHALVNHLEDRGSDHKLLLLTVIPPF